MNFSAQTWIAWIAATAMAALTLGAYAHGNFMTLREKAEIMDKLNRLEDKIDLLLLKQNGPQRD